MSYRKSHTRKEFGKRYDLQTYKQGSWDELIWRLEQLVLDDIRKKFILNKQKSYLDFACGTGRVIEYFEDNFESSYGVDVSKEMTKEIQTKKSKIVLQDITKKSLKKKFDVVTAFRFFLNAEDQLRKDALDAISNHLNEGGFFIFNIHGNKKSIRTPVIWLRGLFKKTKANKLSLDHMKNLLQQRGFEIRSIYSMGYMLKTCSKILSETAWLRVEKFFLRKNFFGTTGMNLVIVAQKTKD